MAKRGENLANNRFGLRRFLICGLQVRVLLGAPPFVKTSDGKPSIITYIIPGREPIKLRGNDRFGTTVGKNK